MVSSQGFERTLVEQTIARLQNEGFTIQNTPKAVLEVISSLCGDSSVVPAETDTEQVLF